MNTPTPFERFGLPSVTKRVLDKKHTCQIISQGNGIVADVFGKTQQETLANAELIVRAVNYHDRLVDMVQKLSDELGYSLSNSAAVMGVKFNPTDNSLIKSAQQLLTEIEKSNDK